MKNRITALLTSGIMLAASVSVPTAAAAAPAQSPDEPIAIKPMFDTIPGWVPNDYESALDFRNTYGNTHVEDGLICIVFEQQDDYLEIDTEENEERYRYKIVTTENAVKTPVHEVYTSEKTKAKIEVALYYPSDSEEIEVAIIDTWAKGGSLDLGYQHAIARYTFKAVDDENVIETDIFSWLPDCRGEYSDYINTNGQVSVKDNYVVFCTSNSAGTPYGWFNDDEGKDCFEFAASSDCSTVYPVPLDGGTVEEVFAYKAVKDGYDKISYKYGPIFTSGDVEETAVADCVVFNNAQDVLLAGNMRVTLEDYDSGEIIPFDQNTIASMWTDIIIEDSTGQISTGPIEMIESNPAVLPELAKFFGSYYFAFGLRKEGLPSGYALPNEVRDPGYNNGVISPDDFMTIKRFDNNTADVVFRLKYTPSGDVNRDNAFNIADAVVIHQWLLGKPDAEFSDWEAADFCHDNKINVFDLILMKEKLVAIEEKGYIEPDMYTEWGADMGVVKDGLELRRGPDEDYEVITTLPEGTLITELGFNKNDQYWLFTEYDGQKGWIRLYEEDNKTMTVRYFAQVDKPVIYLYPEEETDVHVELELTESDLATTYPRYNNGWDVVASPDGSLINKADGTHHRYLFWDSTNSRTRYDLSKGFCVAGADTESFLKEKLTCMGLTEEEMNEFIVYWLPRMEHNPYNLISFQGKAYTDSAKLDITPAPDSELRVFMTYVPLDEEVEIQPQQLETFERKGFTVVEWGGSQIR